MTDASTILYTLTDEAPLLATQSLLPVVAAYARTAGISVDPRVISLAARILALSDQAVAERVAAFRSEQASKAELRIDPRG